MTVHILTLTWQGKDCLFKLAQSLAKNINCDYVWHIRDHNSDDGTDDIVREYNKLNIIYHKYHTNSESFSQGVNYLFQRTSHSSNDYIMLLNNDVIFNDMNSFKNMTNILDKDKNVGVVGCKLLFGDNNKIQHAGVIFANNRMPYHFMAGSLNNNYRMNRLFQAVTGAVLLTRADLFDKLNGLDEKYRWAFEDIDYCLRVLYNENKKIVCCGDTNIYHEESVTLQKNPVNKLLMPGNAVKFKDTWRDRIIIDELSYKNPRYNTYK